MNAHHVGAESVAAAELACQPRLHAIAHAVGQAYALPIEAIRLAADEHAAGARDAFVWLSDQLRSAGTLAAASYIGMPLTEAHASIASVDRQRAADPAVAEHLDELALQLHCQAAVLDRLCRTARRFDEDPFEVSQRLLASQRQAMRVPVEALQHLAAAYVSLLMSQRPEPPVAAPPVPAPIGGAHLEEALAAFVEANRVLETASPRAQAAANKRREAAIDILQRAAEAHFGKKRSFK